jgi:PAS domain S-box-containing protein
MTPENGKVLHESRELYRLLAENSTDMISKHTLEGVCTYVSPACRSLLGYEPEELVGRSAYELFHPDDLQRVRSVHSTILRRQDVCTVYSRIRRQDGSYAWFETNSHAVREGETNEAVEIIAVSRDITERKLTEEALQESNERLTNTLESITDAFFAVDREWRLTYLNRQAECMLQRTREDLLGKSLWEEFPEAVGSKFYEKYHEAAESGTSVHFEEFYAPLGHWAEVHAYPSDGGLAVYFRDISERKRTEEALHESEQRFKVLYEDNPSMYFTLDTQGTVLSVNRFGAEQLGYAPEELVGRQMLDIFHEEDRQEASRHLESCLRGRSGTDGYEARKVRKDGSVAWVAERVRVVRNPDGDRVVLVACEDITERKRAGEALRESEERFRSAFASAAIGMALVGLDGSWLEVNDALCELLGYSRGELLRTTFQSITHPDDLEADREHVRGLLEGEVQTYLLEKRYIHKKGHAVWVLVSASLVRDGEGAPLYGLAQIQDITQSKRDKEELESLHLQNESILRSAGEGILGLDRRGRVTLANPAGARMIGYEPEELIGSRMHDVVHHTRPDGTPYPKKDCPIYAAFEDGLVHHESDEVFWRKDGSSFPVEYCSTPIEVDGEVIGAVATFRNITERKRAEETLRESEERYRAFFETAAVGASEADLATGRLLRVNDKLCRLLRYSRDELLAMTFLQITHPDDRVRNSEGVARLLRGEIREYVTEKRYVRKDGEVVWSQVAVAMVRDRDGQPLHSVAITQDITERKRVEEALAREVRAKSDFLADVSHELRTPLTVIRGNAEVGMQLGRGWAHADLLGEIVKESGMMSRMVEDLLFLARSDSDSFPLDLEKIPVAQVLSGLGRRAEALARENGASLKTTLSSDGSLRCDPERIEQAVLALVDNAIKYGQTGEQISLSSSTRGGGLLIEVADRGPGIPSEELSRVFERYYRGEGSSQERGTGLGLPIAEAIVRAHGGRVEAESRLGEGTRMVLRLPMTEG